MASLTVSAAIAVFVIACCLKLLLLPSYHSTDFEVHRNWLAITHSLPISEWYFDDTSEWTLDYPPFFAYFELALAQVAKLLDPSMLEVDNVEYKSELTVLFMRGSVIATDALLVFAAYLYVSSVKMPETSKWAVFLMVVFNAGLILVDHVHFQYNGILMGLLVLCVHCAVTERYACMAAVFSVLVLMKHLFVPLAPVVGMYLIAKFCFVKKNVSDSVKESSTSVKVDGNVSDSTGTDSGNDSDSTGTTTTVFSLARFAKLASIAILALAAAFGPFLAQANPAEQMNQILRRLFPFGRGLVHAYWAPNVWALYCGADKILYYAIKKLNTPVLNAFLRSSVAGDGVGSVGGVSSGSVGNVVHVVNNSASGIVGDFAFAVLPSVSAGVCLCIMLLTLLPAVYAVYRAPTPKVLVHALVYASLCSFMVGYHVHEKAVIIPMLLQTLVVYGDSGVREVVGSVSNVDIRSGSSNATLAIPPIEPVSPINNTTNTTTNTTTTDISNTTTPTPTIAHTLVASAMHVRSGRVLVLSKIVFGVLAVVGTYSLFPLFYTLPELFTKAAIYAAFVCGTWAFLFHTEHAGSKIDIDLKRFLGSCVVSMAAVFAFSEGVHPVLFYDATLHTTVLPFLPRMLTSLVCALYLSAAWLVSAVLLFSV